MDAALLPASPATVGRFRLSSLSRSGRSRAPSALRDRRPDAIVSRPPSKAVIAVGSATVLVADLEADLEVAGAAGPGFAFGSA